MRTVSEVKGKWCITVRVVYHFWPEDFLIRTTLMDARFFTIAAMHIPAGTKTDRLSFVLIFSV